MYHFCLFSQTPIWAPPLKSRDVSPQEVSHSMTTVEIMFRKNFFLNDHGEVISYAILVAEDYTKVKILEKSNIIYLRSFYNHS